MLIRSRLTSKSQTTIPRAVRGALGLKEGDEIVYMLEEDGVVLLRAAKEPVEEPICDDPLALFADEWNGEADQRAYENL